MASWVLELLQRGCEGFPCDLWGGMMIRWCGWFDLDVVKIYQIIASIVIYYTDDDNMCVYIYIHLVCGESRCWYINNSPRKWFATGTQTSDILIFDRWIIGRLPVASRPTIWWELHQARACLRIRNFPKIWCRNHHFSHSKLPSGWWFFPYPSEKD